MFTETTRLFEPWLLIILIPVFILLSFLLINFIRQKNRMGTAVMAVSLIIFIGVCTLLMVARLEVRIDQRGITYSYPPFRNGTNFYKWSRIKTAKVIRFNAVSEFGGWGLRYSNNYGMGYLTQGNSGLLVVYDQKSKMTLTVVDTAKAMKVIRRYQTEDN